MIRERVLAKSTTDLIVDRIDVIVVERATIVLATTSFAISKAN